RALGRALDEHDARPPLADRVIHDAGRGGRVVAHREPVELLAEHPLDLTSHRLRVETRQADVAPHVPRLLARLTCPAGSPAGPGRTRPTRRPCSLASSPRASRTP